MLIVPFPHLHFAHRKVNQLNLKTGCIYDAMIAIEHCYTSRAEQRFSIMVQAVAKTVTHETCLGKNEYKMLHNNANFLYKMCFK